MGCWVGVKHFSFPQLLYTSQHSCSAVRWVPMLGVCICTHVIDRIGCNETGQADQNPALAGVRACTVARLGWGGLGAMMCTMKGYVMTALLMLCRCALFRRTFCDLQLDPVLQCGRLFCIAEGGSVVVFLLLHREQSSQQLHPNILRCRLRKGPMLCCSSG